MSFADDFESDVLADIYEVIGDDVLVYPVPPHALATTLEPPRTVRGVFTFRDAVMSDGAVDVDTTIPVFELRAADSGILNALVFRGVTYGIQRRIERDAGVVELFLREA